MKTLYAVVSNSWDRDWTLYELGILALYEDREMAESDVARLHGLSVAEVQVWEKDDRFTLEDA